MTNKWTIKLKKKNSVNPLTSRQTREKGEWKDIKLIIEENSTEVKIKNHQIESYP